MNPTPWEIVDWQEGDGNRIFIKDYNGFVVAECNGARNFVDNLIVAKRIIKAVNKMEADAK